MSDSLKQKIRFFATHRLGFDDCRFTDPYAFENSRLYAQWLKKGYHGKMNYLERHLSLKENPKQLLGGVQSAIVLAKNYKNTAHCRLPFPLKITRYAVGEDYHHVIMGRLKKLEAFIKRQDAHIHCYSSVDSRPIAERSLALKAGIGFLGKNTMVIKPGLGSYFFIGTILTTHPFKSDRPLRKNCGKCRLCIDACPTKAIKKHNVLDARKCNSYKTIERKTALTKKEASKTQGWVFGCDICQEVCPYNHSRIPATDWPEFLPKAGVGFDFFEVIKNPSVPKNSALYRSRKRVMANWQRITEVFR